MLFSIVTPVLNGRQFVSQYVQYLKAQFYCNWEAIIVDDGSIDGTVELLNSHTRNDPRFRVLKNTRSKTVTGPYQARNFSFSFLRGDYVCFLDIDDFWHPQYLLSLSSLIESAPIKPVLSYSSYYRVDSSKGLAVKRSVAWPLSPKLLIHFVNIVPMLTSCLSVDFLRTSSLSFMPVNHEDFLFWKSVIDNVPVDQILVGDYALAYYSVSSSSLSGNKLKSLIWLILCYRRFGYNPFMIVFAFVLRLLYELASLSRTYFDVDSVKAFGFISD